MCARARAVGDGDGREKKTLGSDVSSTSAQSSQAKMNFVGDGSDRSLCGHGDISCGGPGRPPASGQPRPG